MNEVVVNLTTATICFLNACFPVLVGEKTPVGVFSLSIREVVDVETYGRDVLQFSEDDTQWLAIHRVLRNPSLHRIGKLNSGKSSSRRYVTHGCINVSDVTYEALRHCCSTSTLKIN